ncbi:MAG TPA: DUF2339 domain-containing protein [Prolixibacteraceae bacterium]|nr:DUF2339 domain-containing protein [Prolixibacteraceae bacterium]
MTNINDQINLLHARLDALAGKQADISQQINHLRMEISRLQLAEPHKEEELKASPIAESGDQALEEKKAEIFHTVQRQPSVSRPLETSVPRAKEPSKGKSDLEKFIGENLINKIGIAITVIGVAIGAKYSIDHDLISPLTRIILGYLFGAGFLGFGMKLKSRYENFSAVLVSGAMAILYFITYAAYDFYHLIPQIVTFALLVVFTAFTVLAAIQYNRQVIAHIGLVGAYAVPFLLSDGSGRVAVLFSYMAIINIGILIISFKKYWKPLYYSSFVLTWLIYFSWYVNQYRESEHFGLALAFLSVFFLLFYISFLAYKLLRKEQFAKADIILLLANSFIFFGVGYALLDNESTGRQLLGLFTLGNAIIHFIIGILVYRQKLADRNLFYFVAGLVLLFITISVPVQLDGNWVTLLWAGEAALLFWIGRTRNVAVYEKLAYPLMVLALLSIIHDWAVLYDNYQLGNPETRITPLLNINFLTSLLFVGAFGFINVLHRDKRYAPSFSMSNGIFRVVPWMLPAILLIAIYYAFRVEIANYYGQLIKDSELVIPTGVEKYAAYHYNLDLAKFRTIWIINYSLLFFCVLSFVNIKKFKDEKLAIFNLILNVITLLVFLIQGLYELSELRESYLQQTNGEYYRIGAFNLGIRYVSYGFVGLTLMACYQTIRRHLMRQDFTIAFDLLLHTTLLWILSSELISIMDTSGFTESYKLGLSILWGVYSLMLIALGIWKKKKHLRIGAIGLFAVTLVKLFLYDISHLDTISKTIVFVSLGILLLIISFLYNKYKHIISDEIKV